MTIDAIRLQNFMAFEDTGWIDLRPITLLFGRNSSGKSVLIRALLLLRQSVQQARDGEVFVFSSLHGVDIGGFREVTHNGKDDAIVRFHFRCASRDIEDILAKSGHPDIERRATSTLQIALGYAKVEETINPHQVDLSDLEMRIVNTEGRENDLLFRALRLDEEDAKRFKEEWHVDGYLTSVEGGETWKDFGCRIGRGFFDIKFTPPENNSGTSYKVLESLFSEFGREIRSFFDQIVHLGPVRPEPQRRYSFNQADIAGWKARGWTAFLDFVGGRMGGGQIQEINGWLDRLELATGAEPRLTSETGALCTEFELAIRENEQMKPLPLSAMGFGLSQALPIVVQCVAAQPGNLVIIEQPELHLHPRAQAALADLFIAMSKQESRFLIETHSEHLLLRLRRRIAETNAVRNQSQSDQDRVIAPQLSFIERDLDFRFVYRDKGQIKSQIVQIAINQWGELDVTRAPAQFEDFFADDLIELAALVRASS